MGWLSIHKGWTAAGITAARVIHCLYERPVIFEDDVAIHLLSPAERFLCQSKFVYRLLLNRSISEFKQRRIARSPYPVPENLEFVPVNFELESVLDGLGRSSFDFGQPATASPTTHSALPTGKWWMISRGRFVAEAHRSTRRFHRMPWRQRYQHWALRSGHTSTPGISMNDILRTGKACRPSASGT